MPFEIKFENTPAGVCLEAVRGGGTAKVRAIEFVSEEDGDTLVERLEAFGSDILGRLPGSPPIQPNQVQHLLAVIRRDGTATVYLNELKTHGRVQVKREIAKGDFVFADDIADVHRLEFEGVTIPKDAGIVYIFSVGWRRAIFYDFVPLLPKDNCKDREYDVATAFAQFFAYMMFQHRFKITEQAWQTLFDGQWFPFITLKDSTIRNLIGHASSAWPLDDLSEAIAAEVKQLVPTILARWRKTASFADHIKILEQATERYLACDFVSTTALVYPRIEGLMRSHQMLTDPGAQATQKGLSGSAVKAAENERHPSTPLLPGRFRQYLESVYFASFNPTDPKIKVSRNSVGHGVAAAEEYSLKSATISLLIVDQLCYCASQPSGIVSSISPK
jgi:hypothetical protein